MFLSEICDCMHVCIFVCTFKERIRMVQQAIEEYRQEDTVRHEADFFSSMLISVCNICIGIHVCVLHKLSTLKSV